MAFTRERDGRHIALYRDADGKQKSAGTYATKREALKAAKLAEAHGWSDHKTEAVRSDTKRGKLTVAGWADQWFASHPMAAHTAYVYEQIIRCHILPALGMRMLADVTTADIRSYFRTLEAKGTSAALGKKIKTVLSSMFQVAAEDGLIPANVVRGVTFKAAPPKRRRALTAQEWKRVRKYLVGHERLFFDIIMSTGARIEEVAGIEARDVEGGVWTIARVRNQVDNKFSTKEYTKTGRVRQVRLPRELVEQINERGRGRVFPDISHHTRRFHWQNACRNAGLDWTPAPRDARRSFATLAREAGLGLDKLRVQLGHTRLETTDIYLAERPEATDDAYEAVQRALGSA